MSVTLIDDTSATATYQQEERHLKAKATFRTAMVNKGTWIFYKGANFNDAVRHPSEADILVLDEKSDKNAKKDISGHNGSMYLVSSDPNGLVLFKKNYYGGVDPDPTTYTQAKYNDITKDFHRTDEPSSVRVLGDQQDWLLYNEKYCNGVAHPLTHGQNYPKLFEVFPHKLKSLQKK